MSFKLSLTELVVSTVENVVQQILLSRKVTKRNGMSVAPGKESNKKGYEYTTDDISVRSVHLSC